MHKSDHPKASQLSRLSALKPGDRATIAKVISSNAALRNKLFSMGLVAGTQVEFVCKAPLGDPIEIRALGYRLSLRLAEAQSIEIVPVA